MKLQRYIGNGIIPKKYRFPLYCLSRLVVVPKTVLTVVRRLAIIPISRSRPYCQPRPYWHMQRKQRTAVPLASVWHQHGAKLGTTETLIGLSKWYKVYRKWAWRCAAR